MTECPVCGKPMWFYPDRLEGHRWSCDNGHEI